ncbi:hypothetical protein ACFW04_007217 [Cataglyphis niger]
MHPTVLAVTGFALLLSSFITFAFLLRKKCGKKNKSPFYILSASDVFSTILTAITLLVNRIEAGIRLSYNWQNNTLGDMLNRTWTIDEEKNYQFPFLQIRNLRETDLDVTLTCDTKDIFMQYGILLAALTNAFVSLLTLTLQCNLTAACMKQKYADIMKSLMNDIQLKIMKIFKFRITSKGDKPVNFFVTSHWLVPFLVVAILYFAEYNDMNTVRYTENTECVFDSNFPMNDFYIFSDIEDNLKITNSIIYTTPVGNKYLVNEELSSKIKPSSAEVDEIVFKVQKIVNSELNYTGNSSENFKNINFLATSESQSMADYVVANNIINYIKNNINTNNVIERLNNTLTEQNNDDFNHYINIEMRNGTRHMINECLISTKFLQLYLFVLFLAIYLLSILLFCILQMRGKHMCKNTRAILRTKTDVASTLLCNNSKNRHNDSMEGSNMSQEVRINHSSRSDLEAIKEDRKSDREIKNESLFLEIDCMVRIFNTIKLSMILCIILWTPMFLGTLLRVFSCIRAPQWLTDTIFLSAISFGIVRNILNMYIIKIQDICSDAKAKDNRIHPVK